MYKNIEPTITDLLLAFLGSGQNIYRFNKIVRNRIFTRRKEVAIRRALSRLREKNFVARNETGWSLTVKGAQQAVRRRCFTFIPSPFSETSPTQLLISFDIPQPKRHIRDWLRKQLKIFGYTMVQQSLWAGPGPLPKEFTLRLRTLNIEKHLKMFKVTPKTP